MKIERTNFEKLSVYKLAERLSDEAWAVVIGWDYFPKDTVGKQFVRAADSIGANIAEGSGRGQLRGQSAFCPQRARLVKRNPSLASTSSQTRISDA